MARPGANGSTREAVLAALRSSKGVLDGYEVAKAARVSPLQASRALEKLAAEGLALKKDMLMGGTTRIEMSTQGQQPQLVRAIEQILVSQLGGLGHHGPNILPERRSEAPIGPFSTTLAGHRWPALS